MEKRYAGWKNRETWAAGLWIGNEENLYNDVMNLIKEHNTIYNKADALKQYMEDYCANAIITDDKHVLYECQDIGSLWRVDWVEVVTSLLGET